MTKPNITAGDWSQDEEYPFYVITAEGQTICEAVAGDQITDARAIAAVPDLLAALEAQLNPLISEEDKFKLTQAALIKAGYTFP